MRGWWYFPFLGHSIGAAISHCGARRAPRRSSIETVDSQGSKDMGRNHLVILQVVYFLGQCEIARCSLCSRGLLFRGYASFEIVGLQKLFIGCGCGGCKRNIIEISPFLGKKYRNLRDGFRRRAQNKLLAQHWADKSQLPPVANTRPIRA